MDNNNNLFHQFLFGCYILENIQAKLSKKSIYFIIQIKFKHISVQQQDSKLVEVRLTSVGYGPLNLGHGIVRCSAIETRVILHMFCFNLFCLCFEIQNFKL